MGNAERRVQRNFLRDYDMMLKVLQQDYVDCARYGASGYAEFIGQLYTLNSAMFQSPVYCDHVLTQMALHYLAWYQDPGLRWEVGPQAAWHRVDYCRTQRYGDALYVLEAAEGAPVRAGDRVVGVNKKTLDEIRPEVERMLGTTVEPVDPEREDWSLVLAFAKHLTLRGEGGAERVVKVVPGDSAVADRLRGAKGMASVWAGASLKPPCALRREDGVAVLELGDVGAAGFSAALRAALGELGDACGLVVDARGARGGAWDEVYPLVPYLLAPGAQATPEDAFGRSGVLLMCSRRNVDERLGVLRTLRGGLAEGSEELAEVDRLTAELGTLRGTGLRVDESDYYTPAVFEGAAASVGRTVVLVDRHTADGAEWLAKAARRLGAAGRSRALVAGRATAGSIDNTCMREVRLDEDFSLRVPTGKYLCALGDGATLGRGVVPDVHLAWTPGQLEHDGELVQACALARGIRE